MHERKHVKEDVNLESNNLLHHGLLHHGSHSGYRGHKDSAFVVKSVTVQSGGGDGGMLQPR